MQLSPFVSADIELSCTKMNVDQSMVMVSVVFKSFNICTLVNVLSTCGDNIEVGNLDLAHPYPIECNQCYLNSPTINSG